MKRLSKDSVMSDTTEPRAPTNHAQRRRPRAETSYNPRPTNASNQHHETPCGSRPSLRRDVRLTSGVQSNNIYDLQLADVAIRRSINGDACSVPASTGPGNPPADRFGPLLADRLGPSLADRWCNWMVFGRTGRTTREEASSRGGGCRPLGR